MEVSTKLLPNGCTFTGNTSAFVGGPGTVKLGAPEGAYTVEGQMERGQMVGQLQYTLANGSVITTDANGTSPCTLVCSDMQASADSPAAPVVRLSFSDGARALYDQSTSTACIAHTTGDLYLGAVDPTLAPSGLGALVWGGARAPTGVAVGRWAAGQAGAPTCVLSADGRILVNEGGAERRVLADGRVAAGAEQRPFITAQRLADDSEVMLGRMPGALACATEVLPVLIQNAEKIKSLYTKYLEHCSNFCPSSFYASALSSDPSTPPPLTAVAPLPSLLPAVAVTALAVDAGATTPTSLYAGITLRESAAACSAAVHTRAAAATADAALQEFICATGLTVTDFCSALYLHSLLRVPGRVTPYVAAAALRALLAGAGAAAGAGAGAGAGAQCLRDLRGEEWIRHCRSNDCLVETIFS